MNREKVTVQYLGAKPGLMLNLKSLSEKNIDFSGPGKTAVMSREDAARLITENPKAFRIVGEPEPEPEPGEPDQGINPETEPARKTRRVTKQEAAKE